MTTYYCDGCNSEPLYLTEVVDPDSDHFEEPCCPYCGSSDVGEYPDSDE